MTSKWDALQTDLHCCGGNNFLTGYNDYRSTPIGQNNSVPDSCCHEYSKGCGANLLSQQDENIRNQIFVDGCVTLLKPKLQNDVVPMMIVYAVVGVIIALLELITVVLSSAYVAQITRRQRRNEENWRMGDASNHGPNHDETDRLNHDHETVC